MLWRFGAGWSGPGGTRSDPFGRDLARRVVANEPHGAGRGCTARVLVVAIPGGTIEARRFCAGDKADVYLIARRSVVGRGRCSSRAGLPPRQPRLRDSDCPGPGRTGTELVDGGPALVLDYSRTSRVYADNRDEIRQVAPGLFLGLMYDRTTSPPRLQMYFALETQP